MEQIYHIRLNYDLFSFGIKNDIMRCNCHIDKVWTCDDWPNLLTWLAMESTKRQDTGKTCKISSQLSYWKWETYSKCRGIMLMTAQTEGHKNGDVAHVCLASLFLASSSTVWLSGLLLLYFFTEIRTKLLWTYSMDWRPAALHESSKLSFLTRTIEAASLMNLELLVTTEFLVSPV